MGFSEPESTICLFKNVTGIACPSCGTTRSVLAIFGGDISSAWFINPLGLLGATFLLLFPFVFGYQLFSKRKIVERLMDRIVGAIKQPRMAIPLLMIMLVNWIWNITKGI